MVGSTRETARYLSDVFLVLVGVFISATVAAMFEIVKVEALRNYSSNDFVVIMALFAGMSLTFAVGILWLAAKFRLVR